MKGPKQTQVGRKRASRVRRGTALLGTVLVGTFAWDLLRKLYILQELFFFVGLTALLVFFGVNLVVVGFLFSKVWRGILQSYRKVKSKFTPQQEILAQPHDNLFAGSPRIDAPAGTGST